MTKFKQSSKPHSCINLPGRGIQDPYADDKKDRQFHFRRRGEVFAHDDIQHPFSDFHFANLLSLFLGAIDLADGADANLLCLDRFAGRSFR
jgi:hypothetical protein